jgi:adenosylhomocysteine nucleosidase
MSAGTAVRAGDLLIAIALPDEEQGVLRAAGHDVLFTGVGKVNAAAALARRLAERRLAGRVPRLVVNFGTAGSRHFDTHALVGCDRFVQRDMDVSPLGFPRGHTPFDDHGSELAFTARFPHLPAGRCGTGDSFETGPVALACDVVDMEAYALAKVCRLEGLDFACAKYITDGADHAAAGDWQSNLPRAAAGFRVLVDGLIASTT